MLKKTVFALVLLLICTISFATVPPTINYQGRLLDNAGDPVADGPYEIKFKIYGSPFGVDSLWSSGFQSVTVTDGLFDYQLGSAVSLHAGHFTTPDRYLGITVGTDTEITPRVQLVSVPWAYRSQWADEAGMADDAQSLAGEDPDFYLNWGDMTNVPAGFADGIDDVDTDWNNLTNVPAGFADGVDNIGTGDITAVNPGSGMTGGGIVGSVTLSVATDGITATHIASNAVGWFEMNSNAIGNDEMQNNAIGSAEVIDGSLHTGDIMDYSLFDVDIAFLADIAVTKIAGTAVNLNSDQTITGFKSFNNITSFNSSAYFEGSNYINGLSYFGDSAMRVNNDGGVSIGTPTFVPPSTSLLRVEGNYNTTNNRTGTYSYQNNSGLSGNIYGINSEVYNNNNSTGNRYGIRARAGSGSNNLANSIGLQGIAWGGTYAYGVNGYASGAIINYGGYFTPGHAKNPGSYAGYFNGDVGISGFTSSAGGGMKIDHPLDPANQYLIHNNIQSPDMQTVYNGNITTDASGEATVTLPEYFEALNDNYRYQLTVIGTFSQAIIAEKINGNRFVIKTDKSFVEVSWQVTGIRKDAFANSNRTSVEVGKLDHEVGLYQNPDAYGLTETESINYIHEKDNEDELNQRNKASAFDN